MSSFYFFFFYSMTCQAMLFTYFFFFKFKDLFVIVLNYVLVCVSACGYVYMNSGAQRGQKYQIS